MKKFLLAIIYAAIIYLNPLGSLLHSPNPLDKSSIDYIPVTPIEEQELSDSTLIDYVAICQTSTESFSVLVQI